MEHLDTFATLNVGLARNDDKPDNESTTAINALHSVGLITHSERVEESDTEPTLIVVVSAPTAAHIIGAVYLVCGVLAQDCIAVRIDFNAGNTGLLVGPNAVKWGAFDPTYFLD